jgi:hypothetical protein
MAWIKEDFEMSPMGSARLRSCTLTNMKSLFPLLFIFCLISCKKEEKAPAETHLVESEAKALPVSPTVATANDVLVTFSVHVDGQVFTPVSRWYINTNDSFTVTKFNYYISNVKLIKGDGTDYVEPESYHLMRHIENEDKFTMKSVGPGVYNKIRFLIGVDSTRNVSGAQTGALDPVYEMFWEWSSGYIFYKLEGMFVNSTNPKQEFAIHVGGFKAPQNCLQWVELSLPTPLIVDGVGKNEIRYNVNVNEIFRDPEVITMNDYYPITPGIFRRLSVNYKDMFTIGKVEN